jgi:EmrB/QacA subfamily drug resistance transporter
VSTSSTERTVTVSRAEPPTRLGLPFAVIVACQLMLGLDTTVVTIALPKIQHAAGMHFSTAGLTWVQNAYMLTFAGLLLLGGRAGDLFGRRRVFMTGVTLFTAASAVGGAATAPWMLLSARAVQGLGAAIAGPSVLALIATNFAAEVRPRALSIYSAVTGAGGSIGMLLGGVLTSELSWRWVFYLNLPVGIAVVLLAPRVLAETERHAGRLDVIGAPLATIGMTSLQYGLIRAASDGWNDAVTIGALAVSVVVLAAFLGYEARVQSPVLPLGLFADRLRAGGYGTQLLLAAGMFGSFFFITQYLQDIFGFSPLQAGVAFLPTMLAQFSFVRLAPRLIQRYGLRPLMLTGSVCIAVSIAWFATISPGTSYFPWVFLPLLFMGAGGGLAFMPLNLAVLSTVGPERSGAASGLAQTMLWGGGALGSAVMVSIAGAATRSEHSHHPAENAAHLLSHGLTTGFTAAAVLPVVGLAVILLTVRRAEGAGRP